MTPVAAPGATEGRRPGEIGNATKTWAAVRMRSSAVVAPPDDGVTSVTAPGSTAAFWRHVSLSVPRNQHSAGRPGGRSESARASATGQTEAARASGSAGTVWRAAKYRSASSAAAAPVPAAVMAWR